MKLGFLLVRTLIFFFVFPCLQQQEDVEMLVPHSDVVEGPQPMEGLVEYSIRLLYSRLVFVFAMIEWWRCYSVTVC